MFGLVNQVISLVEKWQPKKWYKSEKEFQRSLAEFLRKNLGNDLFGGRPKVVTESRIHRVDIQVGEDIGIELKVNLTRSKADRLVGQIERYPFPKIIIVACGIKDENAWEELNDKYSSSDELFDGKQVTFIRKDKSRKKKRERGIFDFDFRI